MTESRREFELTEEQLAKLLDACKPVPLIALQCGMPMSQQENANRAWQDLGVKLGFLWDTVELVPGKGQRFFTAEVPSNHIRFEQDINGLDVLV